MIVVDTDVIAAFWIRSGRTPEALRLRRHDPEWIAPLLWRSEFRSVLRQYMVSGYIGYAQAVLIAGKAEANMHGKEYAVDSADVLRLVEETGHSAYDCEFVALAEAFGLTLVTGDRRIARLFSQVSSMLEDYSG
jgi:predicted nucleic acid-binding protein